MRLCPWLLFYACSSVLCAQSAEKMVASCKQIVPAKTNQRVTILPQDFDSGVCWGAFAALEQSIKNATLKKPPDAVTDICLPVDTTSRVRMVGIFVEFLSKNPERGSEDFYVVGRDALKATFPCPTRTPATQR